MRSIYESRLYYHPDHKADLLASGISLEAAWEAGVRTVPLSKLGEHLAACGWRDPGGTSAMVFNYPSINGSGPHFRLKLFPPLRMQGGGSAKYLSPKGQTSRIFIPPGVDPQGTDPIYLTEGEKKALKLTQEGYPCIALGGVWSWRAGKDDQGNPKTILDLDFIGWQNRPVIIVFDADAAINPKVGQAETALAEELASRGAKVYVKRLPWGPDKPKGADDYTVKHGPEKFGELPCIPYQQIRTLEKSLDPAVMPFSDFSQIELPKARCIVGNWLEENSITLVSSPPGTGKTWLALETAAAAANYRDGMDGLWGVDDFWPTLYIDGEMALQMIQERGRMVGLDRCKLLSKAWVEAQDVEPPLNLANEAVRDLMMKYIMDQGFKLVIIDNLFSLFVGIDTNSANDWGPPNQWFLKLRSKGVATLLVHHTGKGNTQLGTSSREFNVNLAYLLKDARDEEDGENCAFSVHITKQRSRGLELEGKKYLCVNGVWRVTDEKKAQQEAAKLTVAKMTEQGQSLTAIANVMELSKVRVSKIRSELVELGYFTRTGTTSAMKFEITAAGRAWMENGVVE